MSYVTVSLPEPMREWVEEQVRSGDYASADEYVLDLILDDRNRRRLLVDALIEGEESGISSRSVDEIIADAKAKVHDGRL